MRQTTFVLLLMFGSFCIGFHMASLASRNCPDIVPTHRVEPRTVREPRALPEAPTPAASTMYR